MHHRRNREIVGGCRNAVKTKKMSPQDQIMWLERPPVGESKANGTNGHSPPTEWPTQPLKSSSSSSIDRQPPSTRVEPPATKWWARCTSLILFGLAGAVILGSLSGSVLYARVVSTGGANTATLSMSLIVAEIACAVAMPLTWYFWRPRRWGLSFSCLLVLAICIPIGFLSQNGFLSRSMSGGIEIKTEQRTQESQEVNDARNALTRAKVATTDADNEILSRKVAETRECLPSKWFNDHACSLKTRTREAAEQTLTRAHDAELKAESDLKAATNKAEVKAQRITDPTDDLVGYYLSPHRQRTIQTYFIVFLQILGPGLFSTLALGVMSGPGRPRQGAST